MFVIPYLCIFSLSPFLNPKSVFAKGVRVRVRGIENHELHELHELHRKALVEQTRRYDEKTMGRQRIPRCLLQGATGTVPDAVPGPTGIAQHTVPGQKASAAFRCAGWLRLQPGKNERADSLFLTLVKESGGPRWT
jgi:hypothetical protein